MRIPILYSYRRCPYAIRARMALIYSQIKVEHREILLTDKPQSMLSVSPKGTVPVLITENQEVIDESFDIILFALNQYDPENLFPSDEKMREKIIQLVRENDEKFKPILDRYKYPNKHPEQPMKFYRAQAEPYLSMLNERLLNTRYLICSHLTVADIAIMPFIRQFANVDKEWFQQSPYTNLQNWLSSLLNSKWFQKAMIKYPLWKPSEH